MLLITTSEPVPHERVHGCRANLVGTDKGRVNPLEVIKLSCGSNFGCGSGTFSTSLNPPMPTTDSNTVIGTLAVDGWAVTFGKARRGLGGAAVPNVTAYPSTASVPTSYSM